MSLTEIYGFFIFLAIGLFFLVLIVILRWILRVNEMIFYLKQNRDLLQMIYNLIYNQKAGPKAVQKENI